MDGGIAQRDNQPLTKFNLSRLFGLTSEAHDCSGVYSGSGDAKMDVVDMTFRWGMRFRIIKGTCWVSSSTPEWR